MAAHKPKESAAKDVGKDVIHPGAAAAAFPQALLSIAVVQLLLFGVAQHLVGKADFFKLLRQKKNNEPPLFLRISKFVRDKRSL